MSYDNECGRCGNEIEAGSTICPFCEYTLTPQNGVAQRGESGKKGGMKTLNIKDDMPTVAHALERLQNGIVTAKRNQTRILKIIHGYGSGGTGGKIGVAVRAKLAQMNTNKEIRNFFIGVHYSLNDNAIRQEGKSVPALMRDTDLGRRNAGVTVVFI